MDSPNSKHFNTFTQKMIMRFCFVFLLFYGLTFTATAQKNLLRQKIEQLIANKNAEIGVAIDGLENKDTLSINNNKHYPLQSVFKFHIALTVLNEVDKGRFNLDQNIKVKKTDLLPNTWSPLRDEYPNGNVNISLDKILKYTVAQSDNNGCDILLRLLGGTRTVEKYIHSIGVKDISIKANEAEMHKAWEVQFTDWTTPTAATQLLNIFFNRRILSKKSFDYLWKIMAETTTGKDRIKGELPAGTVVAHKTGTSDTKNGVTAAINDIGIVTLPNGKHFAISVFVSNTKENDAANAKIIAGISKLVWDYFAAK